MASNFSKQDLLDALLATVQLTTGGSNIVALKLDTTYEDGDTVRIQYKNSKERKVGIAMDSGMAIIRDVCRAIG